MRWQDKLTPEMRKHLKENGITTKRGFTENREYQKKNYRMGLSLTLAMIAGQSQ